MKTYLLPFSPLLCWVIAASGCESRTVLAPAAQANEPANQPLPKETVQVTPSELFTGELKRLEPHLGFINGCVKLDYRGAGLPIRLQVEVWQDGKVVRSGQTPYFNTNLKGTSEASISLKEVIDPKGQEKYRVVMALSGKGGYASHVSPYLDGPKLRGSSTGRGPKQIEKVVELTAERPVAVWGLMAGEGCDIFRQDESVEAMAKRVEWALVFRLALGKK